MRPGSALLDVGRRSARPAGARAFPNRRPFNREDRSYSPLTSFPFRAPVCHLAARLASGPTSTGFLVPSTASRRASPVLERAVPDPPRFRSQVFSTSQRFRSKPRASRPCFMPQPSLGSSLQSFPLAKSATRLSTPLLPCGCPPTCRTHRPRPFATGFPDAHAFARLPGSPRWL